MQRKERPQSPVQGTNRMGVPAPQVRRKSDPQTAALFQPWPPKPEKAPSP